MIIIKIHHKPGHLNGTKIRRKSKKQSGKKQLHRFYRFLAYQNQIKAVSLSALFFNENSLISKQEHIYKHTSKAMNIRILSKFTGLCLLILTSLYACRSSQKAERFVSVSILPQKYLVERIAGDYVNVNVMVPPGMNPATCDLSANQLKKLHDSDIYFAIGYLPFETTHLYPVLKNDTNVLLVDHSDQLELISGSCGHAHEEGHSHEGGIDPHIWLSLPYAKKIAGDIQKTLSARYPEQKAVFEDNYLRLAKEIDSLDTKAQNILGSKKHKSFLIYHPALTYFAKDYGMEQISLENEGKEPNPAHLKKIIDEVKAKDIRMIFIQKQFDINNAESVAKATGIEVIAIDPLNENWKTEIEQLLHIFEEKLD